MPNAVAEVAEAAEVAVVAEAAAAVSRRDLAASVKRLVFLKTLAPREPLGDARHLRTLTLPLCKRFSLLFSPVAAPAAGATGQGRAYTRPHIKKPHMGAGRSLGRHPH